MFENTYAHTSAAEVFHILYVYMIDNSSHDMFNATAVIAWGERTQFQNLRCAFNSVQNHRSVQEHAGVGVCDDTCILYIYNYL